MIEPTRLRYLFHTHICGGIRQAAERINVAPSTISRQIAQLESELGLAVLEKRGRSVVATKVGLSLCEYYRAQQAAEISLRAQLDEFRNVEHGRVRLSIGEGFGLWVVNGPFREFQTRYPRVEMEVLVHPTADAVHALLEGEVDIAVTYFAPNDPSLVFHARSEVPICVVVHRDHALTRLGRMPRLADVVRFPVGLLQPQFGGRQITDLIARSERIALRPLLVANSYLLIRSFVALGQGVFLMPYRPSPQRELNEELVWLPLDYAAQIASYTQIVTRRGRHLPEVTRELLKMLISSGEFERDPNGSQSEATAPHAG
jgi:DNA-binding transcriptional LysR family regulator